MLKLNLSGDADEIFCDGKIPRLMGVSVIEDEPTWNHPLHMHEDTTDIVLITGGQGTLFCKGSSVVTQKGDLTVYNRGTVHGESSSLEDPVSFIAIHLDNVFMEGLPDHCIVPPDDFPLYKTGDMFSAMHNLFDAILRETLEQNAGYEIRCRYLVMSILAIIYSKLLCRKRAEAAGDTGDTTALIDKMMAFLDDNYNKSISLDRLADALHFNRYYLAHVFKQETGYSIYQYTIKRRVGEAQKLLLSTGKSPKEISDEVGFTSLNQFYTVFKKHKGISPIRFREENSRNIN